jgi:V/A-type H+/Na+-transporting ATPase subunit I
VVVLIVGLLLDALQRAWHGRLRALAAVRCGHACSSTSGWSARDRTCVRSGCGADRHRLDCWRVQLAQPAQSRSLPWHAAAGAFVERMLQLGVNTVSFVRVGAFALAHAGLCSAVVGMAEAAGPGYWPVLMLGNAAIIALEGLVVSIQTTRLVLFEFFIRFLTARGRAFEPLTPPPASLSGGSAMKLPARWIIALASSPQLRRIATVTLLPHGQPFSAPT